MHERRHLEPAKSVINKFGGAEAVAAITGKSLSRVYRWMYPPERGGTGGTIPHADARKLLDHAAAHQIPLNPAEFFGEAAA